MTIPGAGAPSAPSAPAASAASARPAARAALAALVRAMPILRWLPAYPRRNLRVDVLAGAVVAALAIPQSLGYAAVADVPVQIGLYTLPPTLLAYAVFGSSRQLMIGPVSTVSLLSGSLVAQASGGDQARAVALTSGLAICAGLILVAAGLLRIGWVAEFLSEPIVTGFVTGLVVLVVVSQVPLLLGLRAARGSLIQQIVDIARAVPAASWGTLAVGAVALAILFGGQRLQPRLPWSLAVLVVGIGASRLFDLPGHGVATIGRVPSGPMLPGLPAIRAHDLPGLVTGGAAVAMVGLAEGLAAARLFAQAHDDRVDTDQELIAHGAADLAAGMTGGMAVAGSLSKTAAADRAGGRSQLTGVVAALLVVLVLLVAAPLASWLPATVLAAIVVHAVWGLVHPHAFARYLAVRRNDGIAALMALVGVLAFGPLYGLLLAIVQSLLGLIYRSTDVHIDEMGKVPDEKAAWGSVADHPERRTVPGVLVLRLDAPLFWANAATVVQRLVQIVRDRPDVRALVLDLEATNQLDVTTERRLGYLLSALRADGRDLYLVRVFDRVRVVLGLAGFYDRLGEQHVWHSIAAGARAARHAIEGGQLPAGEAEGGAAGDGEAAGAETETAAAEAKAAETDAAEAKAAEAAEAEAAEDGSGERIATRTATRLPVRPAPPPPGEWIEPMPQPPGPAGVTPRPTVDGGSSGRRKHR